MSRNCREINRGAFESLRNGDEEKESGERGIVRRRAMEGITKRKFIFRAIYSYKFAFPRRCLEI